MVTYLSLSLDLMTMLALLIRIKNKKKRRWWVRPINFNRTIQGDFLHLFQELKNDETMFFRYTRMNVATFNKLLNLIHPFIHKTHWRALSSEQRLAFTLRYDFIIIFFIFMESMGSNSLEF